MDFRTRTFIDRSEESSRENWWTPYNIKPASPGIGVFRSVYQHQSMWDVVTKRFHERRNRGEVFFSPMVFNKIDSTYVPYYQTYRAQNGDGGTLFGGQWIFDLPINLVNSSPLVLSDKEAVDAVFADFESIREASISKAWANVDQSEILGLASLGELPETIHWITSVFKRMYSAFKIFKNKKALLSVRRFAKGMTKKKFANLSAEIWLELRYAIRPMVFEIAQAIAALQKAIVTKGRFTARGYGSKVILDRSAVDLLNDHVTHHMQKVDSAKYTARAGVLYTILDDLNGLLAHWGLDQPLEAAYELMPFSFILDWVFNVGDVISSWSVNASLGVLGSWVKEELVRVIDVSHFYSEEHSYYTFYSIDDLDLGYTKQVQSISRRIISPDRPLLPSFKLKLNTAKIIDLVTIFRGIVLK